MEDPHSNYTIGDQGCSWTTPLKKVLIRHLHEGTNQKVKHENYENQIKSGYQSGSNIVIL